MISQKPKPNLKRTGINPDRLNTATKIFQPRLKVFVGISFLSVFTLVLWSVFGKVPVTVNGKATFVSPESLREVSSKSSGTLYFRDDLLLEMRENLFSLSERIGEIVEDIRNKEEELSIDELTKALDDVLKYAETYIGLTLKSDTDGTSLLNKNINANDNKRKFKEEAIAYIFSKDISTQMIKSISEYGVAKQKFLTASKTYNVIKSKTDGIFKELSEQYLIIKSLVEKGVLEKNKQLSAKQTLLAIEKDSSQNLNQFDQARYEIRNSILNLITLVYDLSEKLEVKPSGSTTIISKLIDSSDYINKGQIATVVSTNAEIENPDTITAVFPLSELQGLKKGMAVLVSPVNANVNTYGSIKGIIEKLDRVPVDRTNAIFKVGSQARADSLFGNNETMTIATINLDNQEDNLTGYQWSSSAGPNYPIPIGTEASVIAILEKERPISLLLPFLKAVSGQK